MIADGRTGGCDKVARQMMAGEKRARGGSFMEGELTPWPCLEARDGRNSICGPRCRCVNCQTEGIQRSRDEKEGEEKRGEREEKREK